VIGIIFMRHRMSKVKLNRSYDHRHSLEKNLVRSLFLSEGMTTTEAKAKWARSGAEHLITIAKKGSLDSFRRLIFETGSKDFAKKIIATSSRLKDRNSGYIRLTKVGIRVGDKAVMTKMEFVWDVEPVEKKTVSKKVKVDSEANNPVTAEIKEQE